MCGLGAGKTLFILFGDMLICKVSPVSGELNRSRPDVWNERVTKSVYAGIRKLRNPKPVPKPEITEYWKSNLVIWHGHSFFTHQHKRHLSFYLSICHTSTLDTTADLSFCLRLYIIQLSLFLTHAGECIDTVCGSCTHTALNSSCHSATVTRSTFPVIWAEQLFNTHRGHLLVLLM